MATISPSTAGTINDLPIPDYAKDLCIWAANLILNNPRGFEAVGSWLDAHYNEAAMQELCERNHWKACTDAIKLNWLDSSMLKRRRMIARAIQDSVRHGSSPMAGRITGLDWLVQDRVREARQRGERLKDNKLVDKAPDTALFTPLNVRYAFRHDDDMWKQWIRKHKWKRRATKIGKHDHPEDACWRLERAVNDIIKAEYPDSPLRTVHSCRIVALAAIMTCSEALPALGEFGKWGWGSVRKRPLKQDGAHHTAVNFFESRFKGREEIMFWRPGERREMQSDWGYRADEFFQLLRKAVAELEADSTSPGEAHPPQSCREEAKASATTVDRTDGASNDADAHRSPAELSQKYGTALYATRKALERWRKRQGGGDGYIENPDRRPNQPQFLFSERAVKSVIEGLKAREIRRSIRWTKTSSKRPAEK